MTDNLFGSFCDCRSSIYSSMDCCVVEAKETLSCYFWVWEWVDWNDVIFIFYFLHWVIIHTVWDSGYMIEFVHFKWISKKVILFVETFVDFCRLSFVSWKNSGVIYLSKTNIHLYKEKCVIERVKAHTFFTAVFISGKEIFYLI